jgi:hypothetical protein
MRYHRQMTVLRAPLGVAIALLASSCAPERPPAVAVEVVPRGPGSSSGASLAIARGADATPRDANGDPLGPAACAKDEARLGTRCVPLEGTRWELTTSMPEGVRVFEIDLEPRGRLRSHDPADSTDDDEWEVRDGALRFWFTHRYVVHEGARTTEATISGTAENVVHDRWEWIARRIPSAVASASASAAAGARPSAPSGPPRRPSASSKSSPCPDTGKGDPGY